MSKAGDNAQLLIDSGYEDVMVFAGPSYEGCLIGVTHDHRAIYDYGLMIQSLMTEEGMTEEEAGDFISYNTIRSLGYVENSPIIMHRLEV